MPMSSREGKVKILEWIMELTTTYNKVLDIGVGEGTYALLYRKCKTIENAEWTGVEVWEPYVSRFNLEEKYDKLLIEDARTVDLGDKKFDIAFCGDVVEHMTKEESQHMVNKLLNCCKYVVLSIPIIYMPQGSYAGNQYEIHVKPDWSHEEVLESFPNIIDSKAGKDIGVYKLKGYV